MEIMVFWKIFNFVTHISISSIVSMNLIVGLRLQPTLSGLEKKVVRLTGMMEQSVRCLEAGMVDILG